VNFNITRRQFLQYCTASAAALGLSQMDLLKLEKALATPQTGCSALSPSVIWLTGQACSGCPVSLLNRVIDVTGGYYDADMINALYGAGVPQGSAGDTVGELNAVNDAADLLVGDAVRALVPGLTRGLPWADDVSGAFPGSLLDAYAGAFPTGYVTLEWNTTVMASAGSVPVDHLKDVVTGAHGLLATPGHPVFVLLVDGAVPTTDEGYCMVFDDPNNYSGYKGVNTPAANPDSVTLANALRWIAPKAAAVISVGTCSSYGGVPAGKGNKTGATPVFKFLADNGITTPVINVPGCPPQPDWVVYTVAYFLIHTAGDLSSLGVPPLDTNVDPTTGYPKNRPKAVYGGPTLEVNCDNCPKKWMGGAEKLGDDGCTQDLGCKGSLARCLSPVRQWNRFDDGTQNNWCRGGGGVGDSRYVCHGCIEPAFPDAPLSPFFEPTSDGS
jgi:hydrogenase small subunit